MKKLFSLFIVAIFATNAVQADDISAEQALQIARQFSASPSARQLSRRVEAAKPATPTMAHVMQSKVSQKDNVYIINLGDDQGFVIVSGETGAEDEVLGYCDHGSFNYADAPIQLKDLLMQYSDEVDELRKAPASTTRARTRASADIGTIVVGPLLTTTWSQWAPYNNLCPAGCPTGCVPTAIAQIMNYWKWPKESVGRMINHVTGIADGEDFSGHVYDWDNMLDSYDAGYTPEQANAVAALMADIGKAYGTSYSPGGSTTYANTYVLTHNFSYDPSTEVYDGATASELQRQMKADLDQHRPILYGGGDYTTPTDGHALVCDGYTSNNYFHFNYGWGGTCDGWYKNALMPMYSKNSVISVGIRPIDGKYVTIGDMDYILIKNGTAEVVSYKKSKVTDEVVEIPDEVFDDEGNSYKVTRIWKEAFYQRGHFNKITLGNNVKDINPYTFIMSTIDSLIIGDKVQEIPDGAFQLTRIHYLVIGASLKRIGKQAFRMCGLTNVICKSPAIELDDEAFMMGGTGTSEGDGEWLEHITKLGTNVFQGSSFGIVPRFTNLQEMGPTAIQASFPEEDFPYINDYDGRTIYAKRKMFHIYPNLRRVSPTAFVGCNLDGFIMEGESPYFSIHRNESLIQDPSNMLFNKDGSSLVTTTPETFNKPSLPGGSGSYSAPVYRHYSDNVVRLEPGCINTKESGCIIDIPKTVVEMEGAFTNCERILMLYCFHTVPPAISDSTFNDKIFLKNPWLYIPKESEDLYRKAPGWRRFKEIKYLSDYGYQESDYTPPTRQYDMVVYYTDEEGHHSVSVPVDEVGNMKMDESGGKVVVSRSGYEDLTIDVAQMDSITWKNGFVYDDGEVFNLNDSTLTAKAQYCTVTLGSTVIDQDAQLTIRNAILTPKMAENMVRGRAVDISLSTGEHELTGIARISIPIEKREGEKLKAVYFNEDTGEWEPVYFKYDEEQGAVVILTTHLSGFGACCLVEEHSPRVKVEKYDLGFFDVNNSLKKLYGIVSGDKDLDKSAVQAWRDDFGFWQTIGIDGGWNALQAVGFQPEDVGHACDVVGYIGTFLTVLDVAAADLRGDDQAVLEGTLKGIYGFVSGQLASVIGTTVMQTSMVGVAVIGILLEKFGTLVQERKKELIRAAYRHYYSMEGKNTVWNFTKYKDGDLSKDYFGREQKYRNRQYRSKKDWYMYLKTPLEEGKIKPENFQMLIEQAVRRYCDRFWEDTYDARSACYQKAKSWGLTSQLDAEDNISLQQQISDEYFNELMNGDIMEVFQDLRCFCEEAAGARVQQYERQLQALMNSTLTVNAFDPTLKKGEKSKFAGWKLRIAEIPDAISDRAGWECTIDDNGTAKLELTKYALVKYNINCKFVLVDDRDISQRIYSYRVPVGNGKFSGKLDLVSGGTEVEAPELKGLELEYDPLTVPADITQMGTCNKGQEYSESRTEGICVFLNNAFNKKARFQTEIEKFFKQHDFIVVDQYGNIKIGDDIVGKMEGDEGKGNFTINTTYQFVEKTIPEFVELYNKYWGDMFLNLLDGTIEHKIMGQFTVSRIPGSEEYSVSYIGEGTYSFKANVVDIIEGLDFDVNILGQQHVIPEQVHAHEVTQEGAVRLKYVTKLR